MISRRQFLQSTSLVALSPLAPAFLTEMAHAAGTERDSRILVVIQLEGGNDGINTVVPYGDDGYFRNRKELRIKPDELIKLNDHVGLHPAMKPAALLLEQGRLAIVQGVGYPNPNRSHFESMQIWQTARTERARGDRGWLGRAFDQLPWPRTGGPDAIYVGDEDLPRALWGRRIDAATLTSREDLALRLPHRPVHAAAPASADDIGAFVRRSVLAAYGTADELANPAVHSLVRAATYPQTKLAGQLQLVSELIKAGGGTRVYYACQSGYDTHYAQLPEHERLLYEFSGGLKAFLDDMKASGLSQRVLVLAFSEFGRRVAENSSMGTDHGAAAPVFLAGDAVRAGLIGPTPSLEDLDHGDLKMSMDFRQVYAAILASWLRVPTRDALTGSFEPANVLSQS